MLRRLFAHRASAEAAGDRWPTPVSIRAHSADGAAFDLILGLQWEAILGRDLTREARRRAQRRGATHWSHAGGRAEVVGMARIHVAERSAWRMPCSAAQAFARRAGPGLHMVRLTLPDDPARCWLAVARDGQVLSGGDEVLSVAESESVARGWWDRFGDNLVLWGEGGSHDDPVKPLGWASLGEQAGPAIMLQPVRGPFGVAPIQGSWRWLGLALAAMASVVLIFHAWPTRAPAPVEQPQEPALAGSEVWHEALAQWQRDTSLPTLHTVQELAAAILEMPAHWRGWQLQRVACRRQQVAHWQCNAEYQRESAEARQAGVKAALPESWRLIWGGLDHFQTRWEFRGAEKALQPAHLRSNAELWLIDADRLLQWRVAWQRVEIGQAEPVLLQPRVAQGQVVPPQPSGWRPPTQRSLLLYGPLRSLSVLEDALTQRIAWRSLVVQFGREPQPGLTRSSLMLTLQGTLYESPEPGLAPI